jgi:hypothetical protein
LKHASKPKPTPAQSTKAEPNPKRETTGPSPESINQATAAWKRKAEANFCINLETARSIWRRYRAMVEAPDYPEHLLKSFEAEYERLPDDSSELAGEEIFSLEFDEQCRARGVQTAMDWMKPEGRGNAA